MGRTTLSSQSIEHFLPLDRQPGWHDSNPTVGWGPGEKVPLHLAQTSFLALWRVFGGLSALIPWQRSEAEATITHNLRMRKWMSRELNRDSNP